MLPPALRPLPALRSVLLPALAVLPGPPAAAQSAEVAATASPVARLPRPPWVATHGGAAEDAAADLVALGDDVVAVGSTRSAGAGDADGWAARLDGLGRARWEVALGTPGRDELVAVAAAPAGGVLAVGFVDAAGTGDTDGWLVRLDAAGAVVWQRTLGGGLRDELGAVAPSPSGWYAGGATETRAGGLDAWVLEVDEAGAVLWQERFAGDRDDVVTSLAPTTGGVLACASSGSTLGGASPPFFRPWLLRLDAGGGVLWQRTYDASGGDVWSDVVALPGGGFAATGEVLAMAFFRGDLWVVRLDADGAVLWDRRLGDHLFPGFDAGAAVRTTPDGGLVAAGSTDTGGAGGGDAWLVRLSASGHLVGQRPIGGAGLEAATGLALLPDGDLAVAGRTTTFGAGAHDALVLRAEPDGDLGCDLSGPSGPNVWTGELEVREVALPPVPTAFVTRVPAAAAVRSVSGAYVCAPR